MTLPMDCVFITTDTFLPQNSNLVTFSFVYLALLPTCLGMYSKSHFLSSSAHSLYR